MSSRGSLIEEDGFGFVPRVGVKKPGQPFEIVKRYTLTNKHKASVRLISWGAGIQSIRVPNRRGILGDVVLGFDTLDGYLENRYVGSIVGRVVGCISDGRMMVDEKEYFLSLNHGKNHINGGGKAFDNINWDSHILENQVVMSHLSPTGTEGYPGHMLTQIKYSWTEDNELRINIRASSTEPTPANITSHCLFNLAGHGTGAEELKKHVISINADSWLPLKDNLPTGAIKSNHGTLYDLRIPTRLSKGRLYNVPAGGYNQSFCVTSPSCWCYRFHARILHPGSGRFLEVYSNHPGLRFYTGNDLPEKDRTYPPDFEDYVCEDSEMNPETVEDKENLEIQGKDGVFYRRHGGFVLSPQNYPNAVNIKHFPSCILYPGKVYVHDLTYKFGVATNSFVSS